MKAEKTLYLVLSGPLFFLTVIGLLFYKTAPLLGSPVWLCGLSIATFIACGISYLGFQEIGQREDDLLSKEAQKAKVAEDLRSVLDETHRLYREKVSKLERVVIDIEKEYLDKLKLKENTLSQLQEEYEELFAKSGIYKNQAHSFQTALEDALTELRDLAHTHYLDQQREQKTPKNLLKQHEQLREQFEEKSVVLDETRRRLFATEGFLLALKKERGLELLDLNQEQEILLGHIRELLEENAELEKEVIALEKLIVFSLKPTSTRKTAKKLAEMLEFQFDTTSSMQ